MADPRALTERAPELSVRALARLACRVTEAPWALDAAELAAARAAALSDEAIVHVVLLAALFGHFNRMADAVGIELDYGVRLTPPHAEPATPAYLKPAPADWPLPTAGDGAEVALRIGLRAAALPLLEAWQAHVWGQGPLSRHQRSLIRRTVAECLGDGATVQALDVAPASPLDAALVATADEVARAPWRLGAGTVARLRSAGLSDDVEIFDAIATASSCTTFSRIPVALAALNRRD